MRQRENPQARRGAIIEAAIVAIGERGYFGFTTQELAKRCGLTNSGLLYHFSTKEELFLAVVDEYERRIGADAMEVIGGYAGEFAQQGRLSLESSRALLRALMAQSMAHPEMERLFMSVQSEALNPIHPGYDRFRRIEERIVEGIARIIAGNCPDAISTARHLYALMYGLEHQWLRSDKAFDIITEWDRAVALILPDPVPGA